MKSMPLHFQPGCASRSRKIIPPVPHPASSTWAFPFSPAPATTRATCACKDWKYHIRSSTSANFTYSSVFMRGRP